MGMASEFKAFIARGNVMDLAVGVVIGAAFGKIVTAFVDKIIMPPLGLVTGGIDLSNWVIFLRAATVDANGNPLPAVVIGIGDFINTVIQFLIIALAIFLMVRGVNRLHRRHEEEQKAAAPAEDVVLLREIRDVLKARH